MATYTVQAPDGKTVTLEGPDGASDEDVIAQAQKLYTPGSTSQPEQPSIASDALKYSPIGMVKSLADMIRTVGSGENPFKGMAAANAGLLDKAKQSFADHHYADAAAHFANYLNPLGGAFEDVSKDLEDGNYGHAAAKFAGLTSSLVAGQKGPTVLDAATQPGLGGDIAAGAKGAAKGAISASVEPIKYGHLRILVPQPIATAAAGGYAARQLGLPHEVGAIIGGVYPIARGAIEGAKDALAGRAAAAKAGLSSSTETAATFQPRALLPSGAITTPPPADTSGPIPPTLPQNYTAPPPQTAAPAAAIVSAQLLDDVSQSLAGKPFAKLDANAKATVTQIAAKVAAEPSPPPAPYQPGAQVPPSAVIRNGVPTAPQQAAPPLASRIPSDLARQLAEEMLKSGTATPEMMGEPRAVETPDPEALKTMMRDLPPGAPKAMAKANYAGNQEPTQAAAVYDAAGRAEKAQALSQMLYDEGMSSSKVAKWSQDAWMRNADDRGLLEHGGPFSKESQGEVIRSLRKLEGKIKP